MSFAVFSRNMNMYRTSCCASQPRLRWCSQCSLSAQAGFYLTNIGEDADTVATFIRVLHGLDEATAGGEGEQGGVRLTVEEVRRAQEVCEGYVEKVKVLKASMSEALRVLADINFDVLLALICGKAQQVCAAAGKATERAEAAAPVAVSDVGGASGSVAMVASVHGSGSVAIGGTTLTVGAAAPVAKSTKPRCDAPKASARAAKSTAVAPPVAMSARQIEIAARTCDACGSLFKSPHGLKLHTPRCEAHLMAVSRKKAGA